ncbi:hypothetical protein VB620_19085 [Nodularia harveyana UHCC-0300]|uniref:Uncharacterized protein n=1 Tax=Nodularia harveyana UHCC-0300 TaxID=2974287 RepID=A0ABU5UIV1_9CYAN|nr:hypothetical protein [Nodularia harveyana]MEA5583435.1 hypothetical protein [Nodularia harveyana UHCC-0300]
MMKAKIFLCSIFVLLSISSLIVLATTKSQNAIKAEVVTTSKNLPQNLETAVREKMAQQLQINSKLLKLTKSEIATWEDCLPDKSGVIPTQACSAKSLSGWRVTISGQKENWVYYVTNNGLITLDATASLNTNILSALSKKLALKPDKISIIAAQLTKGFPTCSINGTCDIQPILGWRILVKGREKPFFLGMNGQDLNYGNLSLFLPSETEKMPRNLGKKVLEDVVSRHDKLTSNLEVESIKFITWNLCNGGGPTRPEMGNCPNIDISGWQMIVMSGDNRYVYYIPQAATLDPNFDALPDGMQSLSNSLVTTIRKEAAKWVKVSENMTGLHSTTPKFFDGCLNIDNQNLSCRQSIQAGWEVTVFGGNVPSGSPSWANASSSYNVNLAGNDIRFIQSGVWIPVP